MNIYVAMPVTQEHINTLKASCPEGNFEFARVLNGADERCAKDPFDLDREMIKSADVVVGNIPVDILPECTRLKLLQLNMAGRTPMRVNFLRELNLQTQAVHTDLQSVNICLECF